jgi:hypothetical protein
MWAPSSLDLLGCTTTWSRTRLRLTRRREVRGRLAHRYPILPRRARGCREIYWNNTSWQEDIFDDNEDIHALRTNIVTINVALTVGLFMMYFLTMFC